LFSNYQSKLRIIHDGIKWPNETTMPRWNLERKSTLNSKIMFIYTIITVSKSSRTLRAWNVHYSKVTDKLLIKINYFFLSTGQLWIGNPFISANCLTVEILLFCLISWNLSNNTIKESIPGTNLVQQFFLFRCDSIYAFVG
jgi:hypothetical protein